jgi:DNA-binding transcriptional ArsR family regulator
VGSITARSCGADVSARAEVWARTIRVVTAETLARVGALLADPSRAAILLALMDGRAHTGSELARHVGIAQSTASEHLSKLLDGRMVAVEAQGRHRYFRLADPSVAGLLETLGMTEVPGPPTPRPPQALAYARTCYDHLAGELAVAIYDGLVAGGHLVDGEYPALTSSGTSFIAGIGVDLESARSPGRPQARRCLDWTERRHHLAGTAGQALLDALLTNRWVVSGRRREVRVTDRGRRELAHHFPATAARP